MTPEQAYDWLAPKLSSQERSALDLIYRAAVPEAVPSGMVMVPEHPTREMIEAAVIHAEREDDEEKYRARGQAIAVYLTMLNALKRLEPQHEPSEGT